MSFATHQMLDGIEEGRPSHFAGAFGQQSYGYGGAEAPRINSDVLDYKIGVQLNAPVGPEDGSKLDSKLESNLEIPFERDSITMQVRPVSEVARAVAGKPEEAAQPVAATDIAALAARTAEAYASGQLGGRRLAGLEKAHAGLAKTQAGRKDTTCLQKDVSEIKEHIAAHTACNTPRCCRAGSSSTS